MLRIALIAAMAAVWPGLALAQGWIDYVNMDDRFGINFPGQPMVEDYDYQPEVGQLPEFVAPVTAKRYWAESNGSVFSVIVVDYTQVDHNTTLRGAVAWAATQYRKLGEVTFDAYAHIDNVDGHQLQITKPDGRRLFFEAHMHYPVKKLYILVADSPPNAPPPALFQVSLRFLDENGASIRYQFDENGNATRAR